MKTIYQTLLVFSLTLAAGMLVAGEEPGQSSPDEAAYTESQVMLKEAKRARTEAEVARHEATRAAEMARQLSHQQERLVQGESDLAGLKGEELAHEKKARQEEVNRAREELSRAHRELREASKEVARAHRDLSHSGHDVQVTREINLGDRAVVGVVLGRQSDKGVEIIAVSPDGPAERAGLQPGDVLESIRGQNLVGARGARQGVFKVMRELGDGEELAVVVNRGGESLEYTVTAEQREPRGWQSVVQIEQIIETHGAESESHVITETIVIPEIDEVALAAEIAELSERIEATNHVFVVRDGENVHEWEVEGFSDFGGQAMDEAHMWFGLPQAHGLELTSINEGLGAYFKTDRGVLVLKAREGNAYELASGDVILTIDSNEVNSPSDLMRALRDVEPGGEIAIEIKRERKNRTLNVVVPENRLGHR